MKKMNFLLIVLILAMAGDTQAQIIRRLGEKAKEKLENKSGDKKNKDKEPEESEEVPEIQEETEQDAGASGKGSGATGSEPIKNYAKYDFVPGTRVLFEDNLQNETDGEFPSLFNTTKGQVQVSEIKGEKIIQSFGCSNIIPRITGSEDGKDVLPDHFTIEFDAYFPDQYQEKWWWMNIYFYDESDEKNSEYRDETPAKMWTDQKVSEYRDFRSEVPDELVRGGWNHIAIAVNKNMLKMYINESRTINTPAFKGNARNITLEFNPNGCHSEGLIAIKNLRIAEGGMDLYKRATAEGNFVARGITFDYNKSVIKPSSMGELNRIAKMMQENSSMRFEIGGHTDTDGEDSYNLKLSQQRADAVKNQLVQMGIDESRLSAKGYGETKPIQDNSSPEGKANNRRVEFKKIS